jgi:hypothetical protein
MLNFALQVVDQSLQQPVPVFTIGCYLNSKTHEEGKGKTKKAAKQAAAHKVLQKVHQALQDPQLAPDLFPEDEQEELCKKLNSISLSKKKKGVGSVVDGLVNVLAQGTSPLPLVEVVKSVKSLTGPNFIALLVCTLRFWSLCLVDNFSTCLTYLSHLFRK